MSLIPFANRRVSRVPLSKPHNIGLFPIAKFLFVFENELGQSRLENEEEFRNPIVDNVVGLRA